MIKKIEPNVSIGLLYPEPRSLKVFSFYYSRSARCGGVISSDCSFNNLHE